MCVVVAILSVEYVLCVENFCSQQSIAIILLTITDSIVSEWRTVRRQDQVVVGVPLLVFFFVAN